ncbi:TonB-dependent siderophore receptor [Nostoc sp. CHAB 5715]|uniref:TonB-dependent siderophore receptor n=1 Tax=Nostoc sp. CHAB 5715 TaxID=2780400 RepID=UPI001E4B2265|nr:TonB-dependent siderophore receptor [Nostoc sp. CHAB 5715]MCC5621782.1 TonB-dependent siderophore receptor [Nostoc sp. CHAB 5715]
MKQNQLSKILLLTSSVWLWSAMNATAQEVLKSEIQSESIASVLRNSRSTREIRQLSEIERPSTGAQMLVQSPTPSNRPNLGGEVVPITGVKANRTDKGVEIILETPVGTQLQVTNRSTGNNFIADVSGGQLRLADGNAFTFRSEKPVEGITEITVTNVDAKTVRVTVVGVAALPTVELFDDNAGLVFGITSAEIATSPPQQPQTPQTQEKPANQTPQETPSAQGDEPIELVVTGEQDGYRVRDSSTATKTDTPLRDIPQSIQVVPQEVLRDQNVTRLGDAIKNIPGANQSGSAITDRDQSFYSRGFQLSDFNGSYLRDGLQDIYGGQILDLSNIERVEALRGPASVLYGRGTPGGVVNIVTEQPLRDPFYAIDATIGSFDFYRGAIDLSGPLNDSKTVLYRLNVAYQDRNTFVDRFEESQFFIAPVVSLAIGDRTRLTLEGDYMDSRGSFFEGLPAVGTVLPNPNGRIPRNRNTSEADLDRTLGRVGYRLEHQFSDNWSLQSAFRASFFEYKQDTIFPTGNLNSDNRTLDRARDGFISSSQAYNLATYVTGRFSTGAVAHQLVFGVDLSRRDDIRNQGFGGTASPIDVFNPVYGQPTGSLTLNFNTITLRDALGIYIQDQVTLAENLKLLLSGRFDLFEQTNQDFLANTRTSQSGDAFSPRVGIVYQPIPPISLYASYSRSFTPTSGRSFENRQFQPGRGTQYEVGVKADLNDRLSATLALYDLTRTNVLTADTRPGVPPGLFSIQTGEERSRGVELGVQGEILPGWNIIAGYAYTDARITQDNRLPVGDRLTSVPENTVNLWTTYEIQQGTWRGLGVGLGLFFVGERQVDLPNTLQLPSYLRTDAAIFYNRGRFRAALNFRNLFDTTYFEAFSSSRIFYGEPFTVQGTIRWEF